MGPYINAFAPIYSSRIDCSPRIGNGPFRLSIVRCHLPLYAGLLSNGCQKGRWRTFLEFDPPPGISNLGRQVIKCAIPHSSQLVQQVAALLLRLTPIRVQGDAHDPTERLV